MNMRIALTVVAVLAVAAIFGTTAWFSIRNEPEAVAPPSAEEESAFMPQTITAKHQFKDGFHTVAGEVELPTPCYLLETDSFVEVREPAADRAVIQFTTVNESEVCIQVVATARFRESFAAGEDVEITATWNGSPVSINLIEVALDENLDEFELFIKG